MPGPVAPDIAIALLAAIVLADAAGSRPVHTAPGASPVRPPSASVCVGDAPAVADPDYYAFDLTTTADATGGSGRVTLSFAPTPFVVSVDPDGSYLYHVTIRAHGLPAPGAASYVAWAVPPDLSEVVRIGVLDADLVAEGPVSLDKFLVFVTREPSADVSRWSGPILLRGISRSGRMHSMRGHGPFAVEIC